MTTLPPADQVVVPPATEPGSLHRPVRAVVALVELIVAGLAVWGAFWAWPRGFATITTVVSDGTALESQRVLGNWLAAAIAFGTAAALLVIDATRQVLLAARIQPRRGRKHAAPRTAAAVTTAPATAPEPAAADPATEAVPEPAPEAASEPAADPAADGTAEPDPASAPEAATATEPEAVPEATSDAAPEEGSAAAPETRSDARVSGDE